MSAFIELLPWPAMAASLLAAGRWQDEAWALSVLNVCLAPMNVRGIVKNERA